MKDLKINSASRLKPMEPVSVRMEFVKGTVLFSKQDAVKHPSNGIPYKYKVTVNVDHRIFYWHTNSAASQDVASNFLRAGLKRLEEVQPSL